MRTLRGYLAISILIVVAQSATAAPTLWVGDSGGRLGKIDVATGDATVVGNMPGTMTDIAFDPSGNLYAITFGQLYSINPNTAAGTLIGNVGFSVNSLVFGATGTLYAVSGNRLITINPATGAGTSVGTGAYGSSGDLAFVAGELYLSSTSPASDSLVRLNPTTGAGTTIGPMGVGGMFGLATDNNIDLYGMAGSNVYSIDTSTGAASVLVGFGGQALSVAFGTGFITESGAPDPGGTVPEPATLALLGAAALGLAGARRRYRS